jgi:phosphate transport system protein
LSETRKNFHQQLDDIRSEVLKLAASVIEVIPRGTQALLDGDLEGAEYVIRGDHALNELALEIENRCYEALALQQPMAGDLRALITAIRLVNEIERSGDLVVNICKGARRIYGNPIDPRLRGLIARMSEHAHHLYRLAADAYVEGDAPLAAALDDMDDLLDRTHVDYIQAIFESHAAGRIELPVAVQLAVIGRFYERIGDHAVNIGERVHYMVTGALPESKRSEAEVIEMPPGKQPAG